MHVRPNDVGMAVGLAAFAVGALALGVDTRGALPAQAYLAAGAAGLATMAWRNSAIAILVLVAAARLFVTWETSDDVALLPTLAVALYVVARHGERWPRVVIASIVGLVVATVPAPLGDDGFLGELLGGMAQNLLPVAVADAMRTRADRVRDLIDAEAEARVQAERLRIARDLHDVVAHGLSTIAIQSGVAARLIDRDPAQAKGALEAINATGKSALEELRGLLGVLRSTDGAELRPTPTEPDDIGEILALARSAGVDVRHEVQGSFPATVSDAAVVAVHRIVQEALTNVSRHAGPVVTTVQLDHGRAGVDIAVVNDRPVGERQPVPSTGVGIVGMRERASSIGATLEITTHPGEGTQVLCYLSQT